MTLQNILLMALICCVANLPAQELNEEVFPVVNLDYPGLEKVKSLHEAGKNKESMEALLKYYRSRKGVNHPDIDLNNVTINKEEQAWADDGLKHVFFVHKGYQPSYFYGEDIDWRYWPVKDNELRWQLHRTKWWQPMGKAYHVSKDEKYAKEWVYQYTDWIRKNPLADKPLANSSEQENADWENVRFAWRPLEISHRLQDQTMQFLLFLSSPHFTPEFLSRFLTNYDKHANRLLHNYSDQGNHLLFEAQRMVYAGTFFPELKGAETWRESGIGILNKEIKRQVYDDGMQYELDPHYHLAAINIFCKAIRVADANGFRDEFPDSYLNTVEAMIMWVVNCYFPDYSNPMFSDAKLDKKKEMVNNYKEWAKVFPQNKAIEYLATEGRKGAPPENLSIAYKPSGFYVFRSSWQPDAIQMVLKAGPPAFWHNQPDNGTFELYIKGRNFFPDSGSYVYGGDDEVLAERQWFRQTMAHKTLTLNNADLDSTDSKCLHWSTSDELDILAYENPSYKGLTHRRSVFFVDKQYLVIVDEAYGRAQGEVGIHYQMCEGNINLDIPESTAASTFEDGNNVLVRCFSPQKIRMKEEEGWVSYAYRQKARRTAYAFSQTKDSQTPARFITVICPVKNAASAPEIKASFADEGFSEKGLEVKLNIGKKNYPLKYDL